MSAYEGHGQAKMKAGNLVNSRFHIQQTRLQSRRGPFDILFSSTCIYLLTNTLGAYDMVAESCVARRTRYRVQVQTLSSCSYPRFFSPAAASGFSEMPAALPPMPSLGDKNADGNRSARSAAVGPATISHGFNQDVENQGAIARSSRGVVKGTTILDAEASVDDLDADPELDGETYMSVFTFLKIVSP